MTWIKPLPLTTSQVGLDLDLKSMVILSTGEAVGNPRYYAKDEKRLAFAQRRHAKKKKGSKNREKARRKVAGMHTRIQDRRRDYQHKLSTRIVNEAGKPVRESGKLMPKGHGEMPQRRLKIAFITA